MEHTMSPGPEIESKDQTIPERESKVSQSRGTSADPTISKLQDTKKPSKLPVWVTSRLNARDAKIWFRCTLAAWLSLLLMVVNPTIKALGQATFFSALVCFFLPPNGIVWVSLLAAMTILGGMALAWAWGLLTMEIAIAARDNTQYAANYKAIGLAARNTTNPALSAQILVFNGALLDTRVSVLYLVFALIFVYLMTRVRAAVPKLTLLSIFGMIIIDVFITTGPLLASHNYTLPKILLEPACVGIAIIIAASILIFPESCSHATLHQIHAFLAPCKAVLETTKESFKHGLDIKKLNEAEIDAMKKKLVNLHETAGGNFAFLPLEPSMCRWNAEDIQSIRPLMRDLLLRFLSLLNFHSMRIEMKQRYAKQLLGDEIKVGQFQTLATMAVMKNWQHDEEEQKTVIAAILALEMSSQDLITACHDAIATSTDLIHNINTRRWLGRRKHADCLKDVAQHEEALETLRRARVAFESNSVNQLLNPHVHLFDENGHLVTKDKPAPVHGLFLGLNFKYRMLLLASSLEKFLEHLTALERERTKTKLWLPRTVGIFFVWVFGLDPTPTVNSPDLAPEEQEEVLDKKEARRREKEEAKHKKEVLGLPSRKGRKLVHVLGWFTSSSGIWALRTVFVSLALAIPAVLTNSAGFYYREKGLWALIMGQLAMTEFMSEFVISFVGRVIGTIGGGAVGLLVWYIGDANGIGNPYGFMAAAAPGIALLMFFRIFAPPQYLQPAIMGGATFVLVTAYSWNEHHYEVYGLPGPAYAVFWHRLVLVLCGFAAAFIVQIFPRPPSATRNASTSVAKVLSAQNEFYTTLITSWLNIENPGAHTHFLTESKREKAVVEMYERISALAVRIAVIKFEFSSSPFTSANLMAVYTSLIRVQESLNVLSTTIPHLDQELRRRMEKQTGMLETRTISDVMSIFMAATGALRTGQALPQILPTPLLARIKKTDRIGLDVLSIDMVKSDNFSTYVVALMGVTAFYSRMDDLVMHVKEAVGEKYHVEGIRADLDDV